MPGVFGAKAILTLTGDSSKILNRLTQRARRDFRGDVARRPKGYGLDRELAPCPGGSARPQEYLKEKSLGASQVLWSG
jgi:hypothetical protein